MSYTYRMSKQPISVTLDVDNITWLKGRAGATGMRSVSELLDRLVSDARKSGVGGTAKSVVGTIDIDPDDAMLDAADEAVAAVFERSLRRPMSVRAGAPTHKSRSRRRKPRG
jgi:hypothetical protein